jgi:hypothetical protein
MHTTLNPIETFIADHGITMQVSRASANPNMPDTSCTQHWTCVIRCEDRTMTVPFSQGSAYTQEPTIQDVLKCLHMDAVGMLNTYNFDQWADELGLDTDSRRAYAAYEAIVRQSAELETLLGDEAYSDFTDMDVQA